MTTIHEPAGIETLDMQVANTEKEKTYVRVAVLNDDGLISLMVVDFDEQWQPGLRRALLTPEEADEVMSGLLDAKRRLREGEHGAQR